jgi:hypothetical protein
MKSGKIIPNKFEFEDLYNAAGWSTEEMVLMVYDNVKSLTLKEVALLLPVVSQSLQMVLCVEYKSDVARKKGSSFYNYLLKKMEEIENNYAKRIA